MKWPILAGAGALAVVALFFLFSGSADVPKPTREGPIVAFGDSLVYGTGSSGGGFVSLLEARLGRPILNMGVPANTTADGLARLESVIQLRPSIVILLLGGNDYLRRVPQEETERNLSAIIEKLQAEGAAVLLIGVRGGVLRDNFAAMYEDLAAEHGTAYVHDALDETLGVDAYMDDQIHPNDAGYRLIAERVYPVLARMIE